MNAKPQLTRAITCGTGPDSVAVGQPEHERVSKKQRKDFENILGPVLDDLWNAFDGPNTGALIPLDQALAKLGVVDTKH